MSAASKPASPASSVQRPQRSGKVILQMALREFACHYGMLPIDGTHHTFVCRWGADDCRGTFDRWDEPRDGAAEGEPT